MTLCTRYPDPPRSRSSDRTNPFAVRTEIFQHETHTYECIVSPLHCMLATQTVIHAGVGGPRHPLRLARSGNANLTMYLCNWHSARYIRSTETRPTHATHSRLECPSSGAAASGSRPSSPHPLSTYADQALREQVCLAYPCNLNPHLPQLGSHVSVTAGLPPLRSDIAALVRANSAGSDVTPLGGLTLSLPSRGGRSKYVGTPAPHRCNAERSA